MLLHLVRHGRPLIEPGRPASGWRLEDPAAPELRRLRVYLEANVSSATWHSSNERKALATARALTDREVGVDPELKEVIRTDWFPDRKEDRDQYEAGFGPCLDAATSGQTIILDSQHDDTPYREFIQTADGAGVRHVVSVGMPLAQRTIGSMNIYRNAATPLSSADLQQAQRFAHHAAGTIAHVTSYANATHPSARMSA